MADDRLLLQAAGASPSIQMQVKEAESAMHMNRRPWTRTELDVLDDVVGRVSAATIAKRLHRPVSFVINKLKRMQI